MFDDLHRTFNSLKLPKTVFIGEYVTRVIARIDYDNELIGVMKELPVTNVLLATTFDAIESMLII